MRGYLEGECGEEIPRIVGADAMRGYLEGECGEEIPRIVGADGKHSQVWRAPLQCVAVTRGEHKRLARLTGHTTS